jgi:anaerobic selenocysteine-containing dehydrogenase
MVHKQLGMVYLVACDPARDTADATLGRRAFEAGVFTVAHDLLPNDSNRHADVLLPATAFAEREGTLTDWEGRAQAFVPALEPAGLAQADWEIFAALSAEMGIAAPRTLNEVRREMRSLARPTTTRALVDVPEPRLRRLDDEKPYTLLTYPLAIDDGTMMIGADDMAATAAEPHVEMNVDDAAAIGVVDGARVRLTSSCGVIEAPARVTRNLPSRCVFVPANQRDLRAADLLDVGERVTLVNVQRCVPEGGVI